MLGWFTTNDSEYTLMFNVMPCDIFDYTDLCWMMNKEIT